MIEGSDYVQLRKSLKLPEEANYESIIVSCYQLTKTKRTAILRNMSKATIDSFDALKAMIIKHFAEDSKDK
jgi:hypothetical protein